MIDTTRELAVWQSQYKIEWSSYAEQIERKLGLLQIVKQGTELLLLVVSYLIFYMTECLAEVMTLSLTIVR